MKFSETTFAFSPSASFRDLGEEGVILMAESGQLYSTNESGTAFMNGIKKGHTFDQAVEGVLHEFDVEKAVLEKDLSELVEYLLAENVLIATQS